MNSNLIVKEDKKNKYIRDSKSLGYEFHAMYNNTTLTYLHIYIQENLTIE
jgi:hypothetical protein